MPSDYKVVTSENELDKLSAKAVINHFEEVKNIALAVPSDEAREQNLSQTVEDDELVEPNYVNTYIGPMGFKVDLDGKYPEDNDLYMKICNLKYEISQKYFTGEVFDRSKYIEYINKGIDILKSIGIYENNSMTDMEKEQKSVNGYLPIQFIHQL